MSYYLVGLNHNTAPLEIRESLSVSQRKLPAHLETLCTYIQYGVILSTCNRTEVYLWDDTTGDINASFGDFLRSVSGVELNSIGKYLYFKHDTQVVEHLFRVASGLESMILGEHEILGQVKAAYTAARSAGVIGLPLKKLFEAAVKTGRRVRQETAISQNPLSASSVAVEIALSNTAGKGKTRLLIIGTGEAGMLVARIAKTKGIEEIVIASRSGHNADSITAGLEVDLVDYAFIEAEMARADIIITCTSAPHYLLCSSKIQKILADRSAKELVIVDIGVPRNVDPAVAGLRGVLLFNIDDIGQVCHGNSDKRQQEIKTAQTIIDQELSRFMEFYRALNVRPIIRSLAEKAETIRTRQLDATLKSLNAELSPEERYKIDAMTKAIVNRILQDPIGCLKQNSHNTAYADAAVELFKLTGGTE